MSTLSPKPRINSTLEQQLKIVVGRERLRRVCIYLAITWCSAAIVAAIIFTINRAAATSLDLFVPQAWLGIGVGTILVTLVAVVIALLTTKSVDQISRQIESDFPELDSVLITAMEQRSVPNQPLGFLQQDVIRRAVNHSYRNEWKSIIPSWQILLSSTAAAAGLLGLTLGGISLLSILRPAVDPSVHLFDDVAVRSSLEYRATIQPGNTEIERGTSLLVLAQFERDVPPNATLTFSTSEGVDKTVAMTKSLDDPVFAGRMSQVNELVKYKVAFDEQTSEEFTVTVFDFPAMVRSDAVLVFPTFTQMSEKTLQDVRRISAVVGTTATLKFIVNKSLTTAILAKEGDDADGIKLTQNPVDPLLWETTLTIEESQKFRLKLVDEQGRANKSPPGFAINALLNQPPNIKLVEPVRDVQVSAIEEVNLHATAWDDFGLERIGVSYSIGGEPADDLVLADSKQGKQTHPVTHLMALEQLHAEPDQLVSWHFWAEDIGPDGQLRRTASDMFFAEVRRFEEIYRQAQGGDQQQQQQDQQQQDQQGGQNAERAMELAELQKEIINATWRVIRRETGARPTTPFQSDLDLLIESQTSATTQVDEFVQQLQDSLSQAFAEQLKTQMAETISALNDAKTSDAARPLNQAIRHEQAAYQTLLKMRAREYQVQRANASQSQQQQQQNSQSRQQRQMQQMNLQDQSNRYEQERLAQDQQKQTEEQRENRQVLSRLRELSQRQNDLNKRIVELQSALEEAESESEKDEIEKQLKRLQEEQQQILRDADELQERMQQPANQESMSEQAQQLEQARQNVQQSAEALQEGQISRAATEGTRAERELKDLRDEFQKRTSGQFNQQMRQMRNQARDLEQQQQELERELSEQQPKVDQPNSLQSKDERSGISDTMEEGQRSVENLRDQIKSTIEEAEEFEPLLADGLYDTYRETEQTRPDRALESARRSLERGFSDDAKLQQQNAVQGIEQLRKGIDSAAESVLGDEAEALKIARNTLDELSRQLEQEIQRDQPGQQRGGNRLADPQSGDPNSLGDPNIRMGGNTDVPDNREWAPIAGEDFRDWSDRLRDVEEMIADPDLRAEAARIRDQAKAIRQDVQRHSKEPNWDLVKMGVAQPLAELRENVNRELLRRDGKNSLVPLNREPVPTKYENAVQKYYEQLGSGK